MDEPSAQNISSRDFLVMSVVSFLVYLTISLAIYYWFIDDNISAAFAHGYSLRTQVAIGGLAGCIAAAVIMFISGRPPVSEVLNDFYLFRVIKQARFTNFDRIQISFFAGVGEEMLFRGAVQPLLGIWITSIIFIGIHGYFKFTSAAHIIFGVMMFGLSAMLGYLFEYAGLVAAMTAHALYDIIMLWWANPHFSVRRGKPRVLSG
jgi:uncharacterized protein